MILHSMLDFINQNTSVMLSCSDPEPLIELNEPVICSKVQMLMKRKWVLLEPVLIEVFV